MRWHRTLIGRLAAALLFLISGLGVYQFFLLVNAAISGLNFVEQLVNRDAAAELAKRLQPLLEGSVDEWALQQTVRSYYAVLPSAEVYVLDTEGRIRYDLSDSRGDRPFTVDVRPIQQLLSGGSSN